METFMKGDLVVLDFPFSDMTGRKRRPAVAVTELIRNRIVLCPISSTVLKDQYCIDLFDDDLKEGSLKISSIIRTNFLWTADRSLICSRIGHLKDSKIKEVENKLVELITN